MANFCNKCGAPSDGGAFCGRCGATMAKGPAPAPAQPQPPAQAQTPMQAQPVVQPQAPAQPPSAAPAAKASPLVKIAIAAVVIIFVGGVVAVGGVYYVVYRVKQKVQEVKTEVLGNTPSSASPTTATGSGSGTSGNAANSNVCNLLSKDEVTHAIGVEIVATQSADDGCSYLAKGTMVDMSARHASAMAATKGADAKTQQMIQGFAAGIFKATESENSHETSDANGNVPVLTFSIDTNSAGTQMQLNENVLGRLGPPDPALEGIGDHAFSVGSSMMMVRKGDKLLRIMYSTCPCNTDAVKPLAKKLADRV